MSGDVQQTLNELERKLRELQAELRGPEGEPHEPPPLADRPYVQPPPAHEPPLAERPYVEPPTAHQPPPPPPPPRSPLQDQLDELLRFRDQLAEAANRLVEDYSRLVEELEQIAQAPGLGAPVTPASGHVTFPVPPPAPPSPEGALFGGQVVVEAAPFDDIGRVAALEAALRAVPQAEEAHVRSFDDGRATFELLLGGEVPLVFELRRVSDQGFDVQHAEAGRLELAMHPPGDLPFPMRP